MTDKPTLLLASHCVPDAVGGVDRVRAWQLLKLTCQTHRVYLACVSDGPVNLVQWRSVHHHVQQVVIEAPQAFGFQNWWWPWPTNGNRRSSKHVPLAEPLARWSTHRRFDAVLCTHPALWPAVRKIPARLRICDLNFYSGVTDGHPQPHLCSETHRIATEADLLTLHQDVDRNRLANHVCPTIVLPVRVDPVYFTQVRASQLTRRYTQPGLCVVVHAQWSDRDPHSRFSWFRRRIWPSVRQAVPDAQLWNTLPGVSEPFATMRDASLIVCPNNQPGIAPMPVLQAMATQRAVIASDNALEHMNPGLQHGKHLLLSGQDKDWTEQCVDLLRSASARLRLSQQARSWIQRYATIEQSGWQLVQALADPGQTVRPVHRAA